MTIQQTNTTILLLLVSIFFISCSDDNQIQYKSDGIVSEFDSSYFGRVLDNQYERNSNIIMPLNVGNKWVYRYSYCGQCNGEITYHLDNRHCPTVQLIPALLLAKRVNGIWVYPSDITIAGYKVIDVSSAMYTLLLNIN